MNVYLGITREKDMRDAGSAVSGLAVQAWLGKQRFPMEPNDNGCCILSQPEEFLLQISASTVTAIRQEEEEEETTSSDSHPGWNVKRTVCEKDKKGSEETKFSQS